jgi:hypothetical protein
MDKLSLTLNQYQGSSRTIWVQPKKDYIGVAKFEVIKLEIGYGRKRFIDAKMLLVQINF